MRALPTLFFLLKKERERQAIAQRKTSLSVLSNPILALRQHKHEQALSFLTCEEKGSVDGCSGKAPQRVIAWIGDMHHEHSAYTNPTCTLRAPFVAHTFHFSFDLCRAKEVSGRTPNERNCDDPSVLNETTTWNAMHACEMTLTYQRGGLSTCSVVWVSV